MSFSTSKIAMISLVAAVSALAGAASAQGAERMSDVAFIAASRCEGLAQGAKVDVSSIKSLLVNQDDNRNSYIRDKAEQAREDAKRQATNAQGYTQEQVNAELSGACKAYLKS
jgi:hypothetical protein